MQSNNHQEDFQARAALYALDALSQTEAQVFEEELARASEAARLEVAEFEAVAAQLGLSAEEAEPSAAIRSKLLAQVAREPHPTQALVPTTAHFDVFAHQGEWISLFPGGGCKILFTEPTNGYVTSLLKLDPGARLPNHHHHGNEQCLVVSGEFHMNGKMYKPGDFTVALDGSDHLDIFTSTGGMLLLVSPPDYELIVEKNSW